MLVLLYSLIYLVLYLFQGRYLYGGDSAEYFTVAQTWSIPHPPGYPFYSLLLNLLRLILPYLPDFIRNNSLSIIPTVLTSYIIYKIIFLISKNKFVAIFSSVFYVFLFPIWLYAEVTEVFALNSLIISLITYLILLINERPKKIHYYLTFFLFGLAICHHHTFILLIPGWILLGGKKIFNFIRKNLFKSFFSFLIGLSFYLYAPIASLFNPPIDWENSKTIIGFLRLVSRFSYGTFSAYSGSKPNIINQFLDLLSTLILVVHDYKPLGIILIILGFIFLSNKYKLVFKFILTNVLVYLFFLFFTNFFLTSAFVTATFERYMITFYFLLIFPFALGCVYVENIIIRLVKNKKLKSISNIAFKLFLMTFFLISFFSNLNKIKYLKSADFMDNYAKAVLSIPKKGAIFSCRGDLAFFTTSYYYYVRKLRPDLKYIFFGQLSNPYYKSVLKKNYKDLYIKDTDNYDDLIYNFLMKNEKNEIILERPINVGYWVPYGLAWKFYSSKEKLTEDVNQIISFNENFWNHNKIPQLNAKQKDLLFLNDLRSNYIEYLQFYMEYLKYHKKNDVLNKYLILFQKENIKI